MDNAERMYQNGLRYFEVRDLSRRLPDIDITRFKSKLKFIREIEASAERYVIDSVPPESGIYFLLSEGDVVYVGQASNLAKRLLAHKKSNKDFDSVFWIEIAEPWIKDLSEAYYINAYWPAFNDQLERYPEWAVYLLPGGMRTPRPTTVTDAKTGCVWQEPGPYI